MRQVFSSKFCTEAQKACNFVVELGLWPKFLNCKNELDSKFINVEVVRNDTSIATKALFRSECKVFLLLFFLCINKFLLNI